MYFQAHQLRSWYNLSSSATYSKVTETSFCSKTLTEALFLSQTLIKTIFFSENHGVFIADTTSMTITTCQRCYGDH